MDDRAVDDLRELARRDAELAARAGQIRELDTQVAELRARAEAIDAFFAVYPAEEAHRREALGAAELELGRRREELAAAETELAAARDEVGRTRAEHALERGRDHVGVAEAALARAREDADGLERDAAGLTASLPQLEARARALAAGSPSLPAPADGLAGLVEWASHAHAALFVDAGQVATQRERMIREANELATMLLGEPTYGSTAEQALARVVASGARGYSS